MLDYQGPRFLPQIVLAGRPGYLDCHARVAAGMRVELRACDSSRDEILNVVDDNLMRGALIEMRPHLSNDGCVRVATALVPHNGIRAARVTISDSYMDPGLKARPVHSDRCTVLLTPWGKGVLMGPRRDPALREFIE
ncbi:hypothetical protein PWR63_28905 [Paraburkholderia sp. A2WS-5]|uniref:hypothetical protein n=1 Tax=unclassified Paraburkholderia TaxID=2615204 RepID=UPI003B7C1E13